ncbi:ABC transporter permease [Celeribacter persicus]|uniref:NitT/TauT family transport system permease protein n=1 Tax=Celeribacter persicus TaxID=1651082 RepID=A0A2T5H9S7_9RHOB|nr:ABC transporter permease subunit [Celeribacter persicus]PTQ68316.1 NitT/TauT family transport system permease protein [Celeribacter persicus]
MTGLLDRLGRSARFLWGGWSGLAALALFAALWQAGHEAYGDFILPAPLATLRTALNILGSPENWAIFIATMRRALIGFALSALIGGFAGLIAGYSPATMRLARPLLTVILGVPPIAWLVLALIWFGATDGMVIVTIFVGVVPLVFAGTAEGIATRDRGLDAMAEVFGATRLRRFWSVGFRQMLAHLFPALLLGLASSIKVAVMIEVLSSVGGIGNELAKARQYMDVTQALAWIGIAVAGLIAVEYALVHPVRAEVERWREAARPWGIKR